MSRRQAREIALQSLFQLDFNDVISIDDALESALVNSENIKVPAYDCDYAKLLVSGTRYNLDNIDTLIADNAKEWKLQRMSGIDRNIVRMAIFEMKFSTDKLVPNIVINEAVELAKKFGTDDSARFVNGILGAMIK